MRSEIVLFAVLVGGGASLGCLGSRTGPAAPDAGPVTSLSQPVALQAAFNDRTFFLQVRWARDGVAPALSIAISSREPPTAVRAFREAGCFLGCHDASNDMPNWLLQDGDRPMYLLPSFGGPADLWLWRARPGDPVGQATDSSLGAAGLLADPDGGADGLAAAGNLADSTWDVVFVRSLAATSAWNVALTSAGRYDLALAFHPDDVQGRHHYVSLPVSLGIGDPGAELSAVPLPAAAIPDFSDTATFPPVSVELFLPGITSFEFLVGAVVDRNGQLRNNDYRHGGSVAVSTGTFACGDCHRVESDAIVPRVQNAGALLRLVLRRGGVVGPQRVEVLP